MKARFKLGINWVAFHTWQVICSFHSISTLNLNNKKENRASEERTLPEQAKYNNISLWRDARNFRFYYLDWKIQLSQYENASRRADLYFYRAEGCYYDVSKVKFNNNVTRYLRNVSETGRFSPSSRVLLTCNLFAHLKMSSDVLLDSRNVNCKWDGRLFIKKLITYD